jgi:pyruvate kinase
MVSERLVSDGIAKPGDRVVLVYGSPLGIQGMTNSLRLHEVPAQVDHVRDEDWER